MRITTVRRISQIFFLLLFFWFCIVATIGEQWWELRGWPVNWFLQLDPLVAVATVLSTGVLFAGLAWALLSIVLTLILGRFFCGWVCPFGTMHQFFGYLGKRRNRPVERINKNRYHPAQRIKYYILLVMLAGAGGLLVARAARMPLGRPWVFLAVVILLVIVFAYMAARKAIISPMRAAVALAAVVVLWVALGFVPALENTLSAGIQTGLLDPIPLVYRSMNLTLAPMADGTAGLIFPAMRLYQWAWVIGVIFAATLLINFIIPRFYCRFVCPLGALFGLLAGRSVFRIRKTDHPCRDCKLCETDCEGACSPSEKIRLSECVLCMNCRQPCPDDLIRYGPRSSASGEFHNPDVNRRGVMASLVGGLAAVPLLRLGGKTGAERRSIIRPPGALDEKRFLQRCIKCGQCMRVCPTNVIQPAGLESGLEALWTPSLNNRMGTSGCQLNCVACSQICPTAAIRPITLDEKQGRGKFADAGPIKLGTAYVDRSRCLPWAMGTPCIVCQENCPVSPKAIFLREDYQTVRDGRYTVSAVEGNKITLENANLKPGQYATGDYYLAPPSGYGEGSGRGSGQGRGGGRGRGGGSGRGRGDGDLHSEDDYASGVTNWGAGRHATSERAWRITANTSNAITLEAGEIDLEAGSRVRIRVLLSRPYVDQELCIGCGVCQHECPVTGKGAIIVRPDNETRSTG